jgi:hypothetical protein
VRGRRRIPRTDAELVDALARHTSLLRDYCARAFDDGDDRYLGEVAGKLRVLAYASKMNEPLLLNLSDHYGADTTFVLDGPPQVEVMPGVHGGDAIELRDYLGVLAFYTTTESGEPLQLLNKDVVSLWAQQSGAAHEDPALDERLHRLRTSGAFIGGQPSEVMVLRSIALTVLAVAERVLASIRAASG